MGSNWLVNVGENPGLQVWRIDNKSQEISTVPKGTVGVLRSDDCYIHLDTQVSTEQDAKLYTIYLWVGKTTSQEKFATEKCGELETKLGGAVTRCREVQEHEADVFQSLFKFRGGIQYVEPLSLAQQKNLRDEDYAKRLFHLKGKRNVRVTQVEITYKSLNGGDVFILDNNETIWQWNGKTCSRMEKAKALDLTVRLRDERMNRLNAKVVIVDEGKEPAEFWTALGDQGPIATAHEAGDDDEWEKKAHTAAKLYRVTEQDGKFKEELIDTTASGLHRNQLESSHSFIVDCGSELFVWTGRTSQSHVRDGALAIAQDFLGKEHRPSWTPITKVVEGVEPALFKTRFKGSFTEFMDNPEHLKKRVHSMSKTAGTLRQEKVNIDEMHHPEKYAIAKEEDIFEKVIPSKNVEDEGELKIWLVKDNDKTELPLEEYGVFYTHESYIVHYSLHLRSGGYRHVVYFWVGRKSSKDVQGTAALLATGIADKLGRSATQARVVQNKEPEHFLSHFQGYMVVRRGSRDTWATETTGKPCLYQVRGNNKVDTRAIQVQAISASLNSNDAFVLDTADQVTAWIGRGANEFEKTIAASIYKRIVANPDKKFVSVDEGAESDDFWTVLGGKTQYSDQPSLAQGNVKARLFHCTDRTSVFKVTEIHNFAQDDLDPTDTYILDAFNEVFVWLGKGATNREREESLNVAKDYIKFADDGRNQDSPIYMVQQGAEPAQFTVYFAGWDDHIAQSEDDLYARKLKALTRTDFFSVSPGSEGSGITTGNVAVGDRKPSVSAGTPAAAPAAAAAAGGSTGGKEPVFEFDRLRAKPLPPGVDALRLEDHLSDQEFTHHFKMSRDSWAAVPQWKKLRIKKEVGLF